MANVAQEGDARWRWDLDAIHAKGYTDNVVDLMVNKLNRLPDSIPGLALLSRTGNLEMVSHQASEFFGRTSEELSEWGTNDTIHPEDLVSQSLTNGRC